MILSTPLSATDKLCPLADVDGKHPTAAGEMTPPRTNPTSPVAPPSSPVVSRAAHTMQQLAHMRQMTDRSIADTLSGLRKAEAWRDAWTARAAELETALARLKQLRADQLARLQEQFRGQPLWAESLGAIIGSGKRFDGAFARQLDEVERARSALGAANKTDWSAERDKLPTGLRMAWRSAVGKQPSSALRAG